MYITMATSHDCLSLLLLDSTREIMKKLWLCIRLSYSCSFVVNELLCLYADRLQPYCIPR